MAAAAFSLPSSSSLANPASESMLAATCRQCSRKSCGPPPCSVSIASLSSRAFPTAYPNGWFISDSKATALRSASLAIETIISANWRASSRFFIKAPVPTFTSSTMHCAPAAIFLLITEDAIKGIDCTVPVTSRSEYSLPSAGARSPV